MFRVRPARPLIVVFTLSLLCVPFRALGQTPGPLPPTATPGVIWRFASAHDWYAFRDIARTGVPVDASPVTWNGTGTAVFVQHDRVRPRRIHRWTARASFLGSFSYDASIYSIARPSADRARAFEGRYEYRRYFLSDLFARGFDAGMGIGALAGRSSIERHVPVSMVQRESVTGFGPALVLAARVHRWSRWTAEMAWGNGARFARISESNNVAEASTRKHWGGGWLSDLTVSADVALAGRLSIAASYARSADGLLSSHNSFTTSGSSFSIGVAYGR